MQCFCLFTSIILTICIGTLGETGIFSLLVLGTSTSLIVSLLYKFKYDEEKLMPKDIYIGILAYIIFLLIPLFYLRYKYSNERLILDIIWFYRERSLVIITLFIIIILFEITRIIKVLYNKQILKGYLIFCGLLISIICWQFNKTECYSFTQDLKDKSIIRKYDTLLERVYLNVRGNNIEAAMAGLYDMHEIGDYINYLGYSNNADLLPLYLREVLTAEVGKSLEEVEDITIEYVHLDEQQKVKNFLNIVKGSNGDLLRYKQTGKMLKAAKNQLIFDPQGGRFHTKGELNEFEANVQNGIDQALEVLGTNKHSEYVDYIGIWW